MKPFSKLYSIAPVGSDDEDKNGGGATGGPKGDKKKEENTGGSLTDKDPAEKTSPPSALKTTPTSAATTNVTTYTGTIPRATVTQSGAYKGLGDFGNLGAFSGPGDYRDPNGRDRWPTSGNTNRGGGYGGNFGGNTSRFDSTVGDFYGFGSFDGPEDRDRQASFVTGNYGSAPPAWVGQRGQNLTYRQPQQTSTRLEDSFAIYEDTDLPAPQISQIRGPARPAFETFLDRSFGPAKAAPEEKPYLTQLNLDREDDRSRLLRSLAVGLDMIVNKRDYAKTVPVSREPPPKTNFGAFSFREDAEATTASQYLGEHFQDVTRRPDLNPLSRALLKQQQIGKALQSVPNTADNRELREDLTRQFEAIDIVEAVNSFEQQIIRRNLSRQAHLAVETRDLQNFVENPILGIKGTVSPSDTKTLLVAINHKPFTNGQSTRGPMHYLRTAKGCIDYTYNAEAAYSVLCTIFGGDLLAFIQNCAQERRSFHTSWRTLNQILNGLKRNASAIASKELQRVMTNPPATTLALTMVSINNLLSQKLTSSEYTTAEKNRLFQLEIKRYLLIYASRFYSIFYSQIRSELKKILDRPGVDHEELDNFSILFAIITNVVGEAPPSRGAGSAAAVQALETVDDTQETEEDPPVVDAVQGNRGPPRPGNRPANPIPEHIRQAIGPESCFLCNGKGHRMGTCKKYSNKKLNSTNCNLCFGYHTGPCFNERQAVYANEAQEGQNEQSSQ